MVRRLARYAGVLILLCSALVAASGQSPSDVYYRVWRYFGAGENQGTGLTVFPSLSFPMGATAEAMGTAYTAVARDSSFFEANPAASASLEFTELSVLHNDLISEVSMDALVYTMRLDRIGLGAAAKLVQVPFQARDDFGRQVSSTRYAETVFGINGSYHFLRSFYVYGLAVGGNLKIAYRSIPEEAYRHVVQTDQDAIAWMLDIGVLTRMNFLKFFPSRRQNFSTGLAIKNIGPLVRSEPLPSSIVWGLSYMPIRPVTIAADFSIPFTFGPASAPSPWLAAGVEVLLTDFLALRGGFAIRGGSPRLSLGGELTVAEVDLTATYTLDYTTSLTAPDRFSLQAKLNLGDRGRGALAAQVDDLYLAALVAIADGRLEEAARLLEEAIELDDEFTPAYDELTVVRRTLELLGEMEELRQAESDEQDPAERD